MYQWSDGFGGGGGEKSSYRLASHVHVCATRDGSVLLDLKRDKYLGFSREDSELLAAAVTGWPAVNGSSVRCEQESDRQARNGLCEALLKDGLITCDRDGRKRAIEEISIDMTASFVSVGDELEVSGHLRTRDVVHFMAAYLWVRYSLRWRPFIATVEKVRSIKARSTELRHRGGRKGSGEPCDILRMAAVVDVFRRLRPYAFGPEGRCLLHALTLVKFLSRYHLYPEWVIGVATQPWGAHSWVQWGNFLLDTNPEKVCRYTPILVV
jgi:Transglutaminase-like superfamily